MNPTAPDPAVAGRRRRPRLWALAAATLWLGAAVAQDLQIIELRYRLADEVLPTLLPLVEPGGVLTGTDATLFLKASPGNVEQIRQAVALLDREPRQLLALGRRRSSTTARLICAGALDPMAQCRLR